MTVDPLRQRRRHGPAIGRHPTFAPEPDRYRPQFQILNQETLITLEARTGRRRDSEYPIFDRDAHPLGPAPPALAPTRTRLRLARMLHPVRLDRGRTLQTLQPRDLRTLLRHHLLQRQNLAHKREYQSLQSSAARLSYS